MNEPRHTHVLAVGISSYRLGERWSLPHASSHAAQFALWARSHGVPADQVHLFLSTADHARLAPSLAPHALAPRPATFAAITEFTLSELTTVNADLLYMFWAGHGSLSDEGFRVLFFEDLSAGNQVAFDLNDFFARLRTSSFQRIGTQIAFIDACANRFEELGFDASLGRVSAGKGRLSHSGLRQSFFLAADSGQQARDGAFGAAVLAALQECGNRDDTWPISQDEIVASVRPQFETTRQHPVQLVWTSADGDLHTRERLSGELPGSQFVNAAALSRQLPVRPLRRLADIALQCGQLADSDDVGISQRDALYGALCSATNRAPLQLRRSNPRIEMLHVVAAALHWNVERRLAEQLGTLGPAVEFDVELDRLALIQQVRALVDRVPATTAEIRAEYAKTVSRLSREGVREEATTVDAMLDELYQISGASEPQRPVWEFLLRLALRFSTRGSEIEGFVASRASEVTLRTLHAELNREQFFVLSINIAHGHTEHPSIETIDGRLVIAGTCNVVRTFLPRPATNWEAADARIVDIVREAREVVLQQYRRDESALLIEFLMPAAFLARAPDRVAVRIGSLTRPLGKLHSVVLRLREHIAQRADALNLDEWEAIAGRLDRDRPCVVEWMDRSRLTPTPATCQGLVALRFIPSSELIEIVCDGFPFMAWLKSAPPSDDWAGFAEQFEHWVGARPLRSLARDFKAFRKQADERGIDVTLFWDDPADTGHWLLEDVRGLADE